MNANAEKISNELSHIVCGNIWGESGPIDRVTYFVDTYANFNKLDLGFAVLKVLRTSLNSKEGIKRCQNTKCL